MPVDIHFLRPWVLVLLPLVALCWLLLRRLPSTDAWQQLLAPHLYRQLLAQQPTARKQPWLLPLMLLLGILAGAGPSWQKLPQPAFQLKRATVLVLDMSMSMRATDIKPNRVTQARFKALDFAREQLEGEMALLAFAGDAYVISPLTPDHNNISLLLPDLKPEIMPVQGSDFASALKMADQLLQQAGYVKGDIVFFTDGFDSQQFMQIRDQLNGFAHRVSVLAFGSSDGAPVQLENGELLKDARGSIVLPKVPLTQLKEISNLTGGVFASSTFDDSDVQKLLALPELKLNHAAEQTQMQGDQWQDAGIYLCYLLLALGLWYLRKPQLFVLPLLLLAWPQPVPALQTTEPTTTEAAAPASAFSWQDLWHSKTEQAKQAYDSGDYARARQQFADPLWQGNAAYRAGDYAAAADLFSQDSSAAGQFNLGNSLALQQQYQQALAAFQNAEKQQPGLPGVKENIELMKKMLEQQQQQSEQDQQQNGEPDQQNNSKDGKDQQQEQQNQQSQQDSEQQNEQSQNEQQSTDDAKADPTQQQQQQQAQQQAQQAEQQDKEPAAAEQQKAIEQAWPNASAEESQQLENLLRKVQDEPSLLLKNKMLLEYQKRQQQAIPRGVQQEW